MKPRCVRKPTLVAALVILPPLLWFLVLAVLPMGWARTRIVGALARSTGRPVALRAVRLRPCGGVRLVGLEIAERGRGNDPWLKAASLNVDLSLLGLLAGRLRPATVEAEGVELRIHRRADGSLEFADLLEADPRSPGTARRNGPDVHEVGVRLTNARAHLVDEPSGTVLDLSDLEGAGSWDGRLARLDDLRGRINGGPFRLAARFNRDPRGPSFEGRFEARDIRLTDTEVLGYLVPIVADARGPLDGRLAADLYLKGRGRSLGEVEQSLVGNGTLALDPVSFEGAAIIAELADVARLSEEQRVGSIHSRFQIAAGRIETTELVLKIAGMPITLAGWTTFDGRVEYRVRAEELGTKLARGMRKLLPDLPAEVDELLNLRLHGSVQHLEVSLDAGSPAGASPDGTEGRAGQRAKFRQFGRKLRERLLR